MNRVRLLKRLRYNAVIAVLADSSLYVPILNLFERYGGPTILHNATLMHLYLEGRGITGLTQAASGFLGRSVSETQVISWLNHENPPETPFIEAVLERASPLIVHSRRFRDHLKTRFGFEAEALLLPPQYAFESRELAASERNRARIRLGIPDNEIVVAHFGYLTDDEASSVYIRAVAQLRKARNNAHFYLFNAMKHPAEGRRSVAERNYSSFVHFLGNYMTEDTYRDLLLAADCAVQLRAFNCDLPSIGLVDCISAGMPCVANESLAAACDSPSYVRRIADQFSPDLVAQALADCLRDADREGLEEQRHVFVQERSSLEYSRHIMEALGLSNTL